MTHKMFFEPVKMYFKITTLYLLIKLNGMFYLSLKQLPEFNN
jgi:hypothetical protein